jgi:hypothetical protein
MSPVFGGAITMTVKDRFCSFESQPMLANHVPRVGEFIEMGYERGQLAITGPQMAQVRRVVYNLEGTRVTVHVE